MTINYRPATLEDMEILLEYEQAMIKVERPMDICLKRDEKIFYYDLKDLIVNDNSLLLIGEVNEEVIATGYAKIKTGDQKYTYDQYGYLGFMFIVPQYRGKGINQIIIKKLVKWLNERGIQEVCLEVYEQNPRAIRAYEKAGFVKHQVLMRMPFE